ncbi:uncharacterized protein LOC120810579 isoform X2 [Gasterosteus aculeatus]
MAYPTGTLAQGAFGKVYKQKYNDTWAAIKKVPQHLINRKDLERECEVYKKAKHPNIVKLLGNINLKDGKWIIPLEFIFGEDLETTIFKASNSKIQLSPSIKGTIILGMCEGLFHLHSRDIVHQDLKPDNIMVEHGTNRAVIIDLGLAKFFKFGLSSAMDMGNQAYSAPEVLQMGTQRDQRSDVWAMGKIIAELCARIRLHTPSVCPAKIRDVMGDQPYCHSVCRMVDPNPSLRASVGGVIHEIRRAAGASAVTNTAVQKEHLKPPQVDVTIPSPADQGAAPGNRDLSPMNRGAAPANRDLSPMNRAAAPANRGLLQLNRNPPPINRGLPQFFRDPIPHKHPPPPKCEPAPKPPFKALLPQAAMHFPPSPQRAEEKNQQMALVPAGGPEPTRDFQRRMRPQDRPAEASMAYPTGTLAQGAFGKVYKQKYNDTWAAIKKVPQHLINRKDLERECEVYKKTKHPNIVKLLGNINLKDGKWIIPLEFIFGEDLETTIFKASNSKIQLSPSIKGTIILGMCEGLFHLHSRDIVHQDLKPDNIMVEHGTNRAVIIDLGLAKFFKFGLSSAMDMGNPAYSAPEVLQMGTQRDQRSDVWAMGKIIAELCARIRLHTPSVCPAKIRDVMGDQPYCHSVCRMVDPNPSLRASVGGVIDDIRRAAGASAVTNTAVQKEHLKPPQVDVTIPSPADQGAAPGNRGLPHFNRDPSPMNRGLPQLNRNPIPHTRIHMWNLPPNQP